MNGEEEEEGVGVSADPVVKTSTHSVVGKRSWFELYAHIIWDPTAI